MPDIFVEDATTQQFDSSVLEDELKFVLVAERYLTGHDIRGLVQLEHNKWGVVCWKDSRVYQIDRTNPEAVL